MSVVEQLIVKDFRNYTLEHLDVSSPFVVLIGPNGSGKTNLLESLSLLTPGRGLRGTSLENLARFGCGAWTVSARLLKGEERITLGSSWHKTRDSSSGNRKIRIDGASYKSSGAFSAFFNVIWLIPAMDGLFSGTSSLRRGFLDRLCLAYDPNHKTNLSVFEKNMRERNRLLLEDAPQNRWLSVIENTLAERALMIAETRLNTLSRLRNYMHEMQEERQKSAFPWSFFEISGDLEHALQNQPALMVEENYRKTLHENRAKDKALKRTLKGPHRSDFIVSHGPKGVLAASCSTGEQKALLIGLLLSHTHSLSSSETTPLLLLDEATAHLDPFRREALFQELSLLKTQTWMTGTDIYFFESLKNKCVFHILNGKII